VSRWISSWVACLLWVHAASAALVNATFDVSTPVDAAGPGEPAPPVEPMQISFTIAFDPSMTDPLTQAGIVLDASNVAASNPIQTFYTYLGEGYDPSIGSVVYSGILYVGTWDDTSGSPTLDGTNFDASFYVSSLVQAGISPVTSVNASCIRYENDNNEYGNPGCVDGPGPGGPVTITVSEDIPEPSTWTIFVLGVCVLFGGRLMMTRRYPNVWQMSRIGGRRHSS
jgi:hypothetical protein